MQKILDERIEAFLDFCKRKNINLFSLIKDGEESLDTIQLIRDMQERIKSLEDSLNEPFGDREAQTVIAMQKEAIESKRKLTREIDVILNGEKAAQQASLCDLVPQIKELTEGYIHIYQKHQDLVRLSEWSQEAADKRIKELERERNEFLRLISNRWRGASKAQ